MASNSPLRRLTKRVLYSMVPESVYRCVQALAMSWDIRRGTLTEPEIALVPRAVRPGDVVLDLGANFGLYTYHLSRAVGATGRVYGFEPIPFTYATLRMVARILGINNATLVPKGCGEKAETMVFRIPLQTSGAISGGLVHLAHRDDDRPGKETQVRWDKTTSVRCEVIALDDFLGDISGVAFVKADIEGAELLAFKGAEKILDRNVPTILCEINPWYLAGFGLSCDELCHWLFARGYQLYRFEPREPCLQPVRDVADIIEGNYVFAHPRRLDRLAGLLREGTPAVS